MFLTAACVGVHCCGPALSIVGWWAGHHQNCIGRMAKDTTAVLWHVFQPLGSCNSGIDHVLWTHGHVFVLVVSDACMSTVVLPSQHDPLQ